MRTYTELSKLPTWEERFRYLKLWNQDLTGSFGREFNMKNRKRWEAVRREVILRDQGLDLGAPGIQLDDKTIIIVHHMDPVTEDEFYRDDDRLYDPEYLISCSQKTHNYIHYNSEKEDPEWHPRTRNDTIPWRKGD